MDIVAAAAPADLWAYCLASFSSASKGDRAIFAAILFAVVLLVFYVFRRHVIGNIISPSWAVRSLAGDVPLIVTDPPELYTENTRLVDAITRAVLDEDAGVFVMFAPPQYGKSTAIRHVLHDLYNERLITGTILLPGYEYAQKGKPTTIPAWLGQYTHSRTPDSLCDTFPSVDHKTVLLLDQFENVLNLTNRAEIEDMIHSVAVQSSDSKKFVVLIVTTIENDYNLILGWNGGQKIRPVFGNDVFVWRASELIAVVETMKKLGKVALTTPTEQALLQAINSGQIPSIGELFKYLSSHNLRPFTKKTAFPFWKQFYVH
eukprot:m.239801 g.239801  ORF g.239801 m.239801 type:complete len:317 (-) comp13542_c0_seq1:127-1077(-)